jgi:hypothetical protein
MAARLAKHAYEIAVTEHSVECARRRSPKCRAAKTTLSQARTALSLKASIRVADPAAERLGSLLGISHNAVALYSPLALPLGLELGGFVFLAIGLSPRAKQRVTKAQRSGKKVKSKPKPSALPAASLLTGDRYVMG